MSDVLPAALLDVTLRNLRDHLQRGWGRVELAELPHQYLQLTPLVGVPDGVEKGLREGDNLGTA